MAAPSYALRTGILHCEIPRRVRVTTELPQCCPSRTLTLAEITDAVVVPRRPPAVTGTASGEKEAGIHCLPLFSSKVPPRRNLGELSLDPYSKS